MEARRVGTPERHHSRQPGPLGIALSIAKKGRMIPIYVSDATSHIDKQVGNSACWGERGRGGQAMGLSDGMYG